MTAPARGADYEQRGSLFRRFQFHSDGSNSRGEEAASFRQASGRRIDGTLSAIVQNAEKLQRILLGHLMRVR